MTSITVLALAVGAAVGAFRLARRHVALAAALLASCLLLTRVAVAADGGTDPAGIATSPGVVLDKTPMKTDGQQTPAPVATNGQQAPVAAVSTNGIATSPGLDESPVGLWQRLVTDWHDGKLLDAVLLLVFSLVLAARKLPKVGPWLSEGRRGAVVAAVVAMLTTGLATLASKTVTIEWLEGALLAGFTLWINSHGGGSGSGSGSDQSS